MDIGLIIPPAPKWNIDIRNTTQNGSQAIQDVAPMGLYNIYQQFYKGKAPMELAAMRNNRPRFR